MPEGLKIQVGADVQQAVKELKKLETQTEATFKKTGNVFAPALSKGAASLDKYTKSSNTATQATLNLSRVVQDAPFGFIGIANNLNPLLESFQRLKAETGSNKAALKGLAGSLTGAGGLGLALSLASSLAIVFSDKIFGAGKAAKEATSAADQLKDSVKGIFEAVGKEATQITALVAVLKSETETRNRKLDAIKELQSLQPDIFKNLKLEGQAVVGLDNAYSNYLASLKTVIAAKITQAKLEQLITKQLILQGSEQTASVKNALKGIEEFNKARLKAAQADPSQQGNIIKQLVGSREARKKELDTLQSDIDAAFKELVGFSAGIQLKSSKDALPKAVKEFIAKFPPIKAPLAMEFTFDDKNFKFIALGGKNRTFKEILEDKINKDIQNLVVTPRINLSPQAIENNNITAALRKQQEAIAQIFGISTAESPLTKLQKEAVFAAQTINDVLQPAFKGLFDAILAGENPLKAFFTSLGNAVAQLVQKLISAAITAAILSAIFPAGVGGSKGFGSIFGKILGFAAGGLVTGPQLALIGEGAGTSRANPEVVAPLDKLKGMLTGLGGGSQAIILNTRIRGNDLALVQARTSRSQRRTTGR